jgi:hypothetical protein
MAGLGTNVNFERVLLMKSYENLPGAVKLPEGYFWRVVNGPIGPEVHIRRKQFIGSTRVVYSFISTQRLGVGQLEGAVERAFEYFLDVQSKSIDDYYGDYA